MNTFAKNDLIPELLLVDKPKHWTSNDVVKKVKSIIKVKKIGHAGTLDPLASGLLILGINKGTKLLNNLLLDTKTYLATIHFNYYTDTNDSEGQIQEYQYKDINLDDIKKELNSFKNSEYHQFPPKYSAIKINGQKAYDLARKNVDFKIDSKVVKLINYNIISYVDKELIVEITVSKGFYVRSFAYDLGIKLNNFANLANLVRTKIGEHSLKEAHTIKEIYDLYNK